MGFAANSQSINDYRRTHQNLLAKQNNIKDKIKVEEAQKYARDLYGDKETAGNADIYSEGWNSGRVNPYQDANIPSTKTIDVSRYAMPVKHKVVNSHFGYRKQFGRMHKGTDLKANIGDTIYAAFTGKVRLTKFERNGYGFYVIVRHDNGLETVYGHLSKFLVKENQYVKATATTTPSTATAATTPTTITVRAQAEAVAANQKTAHTLNTLNTERPALLYQELCWSFFCIIVICTEEKNSLPLHIMTNDSSTSWK